MAAWRDSSGVGAGGRSRAVPLVLAAAAALVLAGSARAECVELLERTSVAATPPTAATAAIPGQASKTSVEVLCEGCGSGDLGVTLRPMRGPTSDPSSLAFAGIASTSGASTDPAGHVHRWTFEAHGAKTLRATFTAPTKFVTAWLCSESAGAAGGGGVTETVSLHATDRAHLAAIEGNTAAAVPSGETEVTGSVALVTGDAARLDLIWVGIFLTSGITFGTMVGRWLANEAEGWGLRS